MKFLLEVSLGRDYSNTKFEAAPNLGQEDMAGQSLGFTVWWLAYHASIRLVVVSIPRLGSPSVCGFPLGFPTHVRSNCQRDPPFSGFAWGTPWATGP
jgi:hypothetical protein